MRFSQGFGRNSLSALTQMTAIGNWYAIRSTSLHFLIRTYDKRFFGTFFRLKKIFLLCIRKSRAAIHVVSQQAKRFVLRAGMLQWSRNHRNLENLKKWNDKFRGFAKTQFHPCCDTTPNASTYIKVARVLLSQKSTARVCRKSRFASPSRHICDRRP